MVVPEKYRPVIRLMAEFIANPDLEDGQELVKIGNGEYPDVIKGQL